MKKKHKIILASSSPRRKKIIEEMGLEFKIIPSDYEEFIENPDFSYEKIENLAYQKAKSVLDKILDSKIKNEYPKILSADTVVVLDEKILGKPKDEAEAKKMLENLSGKKHSVVTSICIINTINLESKLASVTSYVEFENLSEQTIEYYIKTFKPLDKAGSYGIQELPEGFIKSIEGSFENIIGLCPIEVKKLL